MFSERVSHHLTCQLPCRERSWRNHQGWRQYYWVKSVCAMISSRSDPGRDVHVTETGSTSSWSLTVQTPTTPLAKPYRPAVPARGLSSLADTAG
jgi:hypothetical protein